MKEATRERRESSPLGRFVGLEIYTDRGHLAFGEVGEAWTASSGLGDFLGKLQNLPFYRAMSFTLTFTFVVTPLMIIFGLIILGESESWTIRLSRATVVTIE